MKKILSLTLFLFLLTSDSVTGFEYNPLPDNGQINYWGATMQGYYHHDTHTLDMWTWQAAPPRTISFSRTKSVCPLWFGGTELVASYDHPIGTSNLPIGAEPGSAILYNAFSVSSTGIPYWGELANPNGIVMPAEAIITKNPVVGEVIEAWSVTYTGCNTQVLYPSFHWRYQTTAHYDTWNGYSDVIRTDLVEYAHESDPTAKDWVYTYFFVRGIGMVNVVWGKLDPLTNMVDGWAIGKMN